MQTKDEVKKEVQYNEAVASVAFQLKPGTYVAAAWSYDVVETSLCFDLILFRHPGEQWTLVCHQGGHEAPLFPDGKTEITFADDELLPLVARAQSLGSFLQKDLPGKKIEARMYIIATADPFELIEALAELPFLDLMEAPPAGSLPN